ncbi:MAG: Gfo/Idh/MocA family oxidoreductase [Acidobacteriaceae bacterium]|nr:Gfo/Idh/MocA family oxidoreductase [Acidobacteriaceae bacterium]
MNIGIVGLGFMGASHLDAYSVLPGACVSAVCTQDERRLSGDLRSVGGNIARQKSTYDFSNTNKYAHWRELVLDPAVHIVDICLPTDLHAPVAIAGLTAGKHVLCEKPMALTTADCDRMISTAEQQNRILMIGHVLRFWPEYVFLQKFAESADYGPVRSATFLRSCGLPDWSKWLPVEARSGGAILDLLIHDIDQILRLFGMPQRVAAKPLGTVDGLMATLIYPGGPEVRLQGGWFLPGAALQMSFQIRADRAELELASEGLFLSDTAGNRSAVEVLREDGYHAQIRYFLDCCQNGKQPERCPPRASAEAVRLALLLKQSRAANGETITT